MAPVTKDIDQVSTLIQLYFMFDLLELDIDNVFSQSGERFVFYIVVSTEATETGTMRETGSSRPQMVPDPNYRRHLNSRLRT